MGNVIALAVLREHQDQAMKQIQQENQFILDNIAIPIWLFDERGGIVTFNRAASVFFRESLPDRNRTYQCREIFSCTKPDSECPVHMALADGKPHSRRYSRNGKEYIIGSSPIVDSSGKIRGIVNSAQDITSLIRLSSDREVLARCLSNLVRENDMHHAIELSIRDICEHVGASRCYIFRFDTAAKTFSSFIEFAANGQPSILGGFRNQPYTAKPDWETMFAKNDMLSFPDFGKNARLEGLQFYRAFVEKNKVRSLYAFGIKPGGRFWGYLGLLYENTPHVITEDEQDFTASIVNCVELMLAREQHVNDLHAALLRAEAADKAKSMFLASMSHEIRTPLNSVIGFAELLRDGTLPQDVQKDYLEAISSSGNALLDLINDVLDLSKLEAGQMKFMPVEVDLASIIREVGSIFRQKCAEKRIEFRPVIQKDMPVVCLDSLRFRQILFNLIGNAVKFTERGSITADARFRRGKNSLGTLELHIIDTGIGIPQEDQKKLFQFFIQSDNARGISGGTGTGLGLAICRRMVEKMNGSIHLQSEPGKGSDFTVILEDVAFREGKLAPAAQEQVIAPLRTSAHALLVDDTPMNLKVLAAMLEKSGVETVTASNAEEALRRLAESSFDFMLTDLWMPGMNGAELAKKIREDRKYDSMKIVALTADAEVKSSFNMKNFSAVLLKPVTLEKIAQLAAEIMGAGQKGDRKS